MSETDWQRTDRQRVAARQTRREVSKREKEDWYLDHLLTLAWDPNGACTTGSSSLTGGGATIRN